MITVERVDFISIPTRDVARAKRFYGETLGLPLEKDRPTGAEYRAGQVTLGIWNPEDQGLEFSANQSGFALRVPDVAQARRALEEQASSSTWRRSTPASATWRSCATPTGTRSSCTGVTRPEKADPKRGSAAGSARLAAPRLHPPLRGRHRDDAADRDRLPARRPRSQPGRGRLRAGCLGAAGLVGTILAGVAADRFGAGRTAIAGLALSGAGTAGFLAVHSLGVAVLAASLQGAGFAITWVGSSRSSSARSTTAAVRTCSA